MRRRKKGYVTAKVLTAANLASILLQGSGLRTGIGVCKCISATANPRRDPWTDCGSGFAAGFCIFCGRRRDDGNFLQLHTLCLKKVPTFKLFVTLSNLSRFLMIAWSR